MTKFFNYKWVLMAVLATGLTSCKDSFIELDPPTSITEDVAFSNEAGMEGALLGAYQGLRDTDVFGRTIPVLGDLMADNIYVSTTNSGRYTAYNSYTYVANDSYATSLWNDTYTVILRANNVINSTLTTSTTVEQYKGEAYAIRALCYFTLVRFFARPYTDDPSGLGVPIVTTYDPDLKPARNTIEEVYTLIIDDLTKAYSMMTTYSNSSQFSKYAAKALLAKVYLSQGDKTNAKAAALDVINNGGFTAVTASNYSSYWTNAAVTTDKVETIFEVSSDAVGNNAYDALSYLYSRNGNYGDLLAPDEFYESFEDDDVRKSLFYPSVRGGLDAIYIDKYPAISGDRSDTKVLRLSDMYLIAAEASYPDNETDALTYLNYITSRRGASTVTATGSELFEAIITERRKELAFEGDRYFDLQRLKRDVTRGTNYPTSARSLEYSNFRRILGIPEQETNSNANIASQQNPGY
ncbi:MAG: RagB/SusD family nutrient uptake outer membrane protein [Siphonobacter sp.]